MKLPNGWTLPAYALAATLIANAADALTPVEKMPVSEWAEKHRIIDGVPWSFAEVPYLRRPMDCFSSDQFSRVVVQGPAQAAKSELMNNCAAWVIAIDPSNSIWLQTDEAQAKDYLKTRFNPLIKENPTIRKRQALGNDGGPTLRQFKGGMNLWFVWPTKGQLQSRPAQNAFGDDIDRIRTNISNAGHWLGMLEARQTTFIGRERGVFASSPELGPDAGIEAMRKDGTNEQPFWKCLHCGEHHEVNFEKNAQFDKSGTAADAERSAVMFCPECGGIFESDDKAKLRESLVWVGPNQTVDENGAVIGPDIETRVASFRIDAAMGFAPWGELARRWRSAEIAFERTQDEDHLRTFYNTGLGLNYRSRFANKRPLESDDLAARIEGAGYTMGQVPEGVKVLTAAIDIQARSFEVEVKGWKDNFESCIIDRFSISQLEDGRTEIRPHTYPEQWAILLSRVFWKRYSVQGDGELTMPIYNVAIDTGGLDGVTENAKQFWYLARKAGVREMSITLFKGGNNKNAPLMPNCTWLEKTQNGKPMRRGARMWVVPVHRLKNITDARLRRNEPGPGFIHMPIDFPRERLEELAAEEKNNSGDWVRKKGNPPNETFDLEGMNIFALMRGGQQRPDLRWVPTWARSASITLNDNREVPKLIDGDIPQSIKKIPRRKKARRRGKSFAQNWGNS